LVHTWDLARAAGLAADFDEELCEDAYRAARVVGVGRDAGMVGPEMPVAADAPASDKLAAFYGRDPAWAP
jgi:hypothetical protein